MASVALAACGTSTGGGNANAPTKVQIAAEGPFTGDEASIGKGALQGIQLAVNDFNKAGGVHGTQVNLVIYDDNHKAQTATTLQAAGISDPTVMGIVGPMNSSVVLASEPGLQRDSATAFCHRVRVGDQGNGGRLQRGSSGQCSRRQAGSA